MKEKTPKLDLSQEDEKKLTEEEKEAMKKKAWEVLRPVFQKLEDSSQELFQEARIAVQEALGIADPDRRLFREGDGSLAQYFHRQITFAIIELIRKHQIAIDKPHSKQNLEDFVDEALARYGSPISQERVREKNTVEK